MTSRERSLTAVARVNGSFAILLAGGCAAISPREHVQESIGLVEERTGLRPDWHAPWDALPPPWDGQSTLALGDAVALALRNNRELRAELETIGQANAQLVQAGLLQNPTLNLMAMFPEGGGRSMLRSSGFPLQPLQDLWLRPARKRVALAELQQAVLRVADRAVQIAADVKVLYARIQYTRRAIELTRANIEIIDQTRELIRAQQIAGTATLVEVNVAWIRSLRLQSELLTMQTEHKSLKRELLMQMGFATASDAWGVANLQGPEAEMEAPLPEEDLLELARAHRLDLQAAEWQVSAARHEVELMRKEGWPELALGLGFERAPAPRSQNPQLSGRVGNAVAQAAQGGTGEGAPIMPFGPTEREIDWTVGPMLDVELPIFDRNQAQVARAFHEFRQTLAEYDAVWQSIASQVRDSAVMYAQAYEQVRFFREAILPEVERNSEIVREAYRAGTEKVTILLQVQEDVITTQLEALRFVRDALVTRAELERRVGGRLTFPDLTSEIPPDKHKAEQQDEPH